MNISLGTALECAWYLYYVRAFIKLDIMVNQNDKINGVDDFYIFLELKIQKYVSRILSIDNLKSNNSFMV